MCKCEDQRGGFTKNKNHVRPVLLRLRKQLMKPEKQTRKQTFQELSSRAASK